MIVRPSFTGVGLSRRNDADAIVALSVGNGEEQLGHKAGSEETLLAIVLGQIQFDECQWVLKHAARFAETDFVFLEIAISFGVIPLEFIALHDTNGYHYKRQAGEGRLGFDQLEAGQENVEKSIAEHEMGASHRKARLCQDLENRFEPRRSVPRGGLDR